MRIIRKRRKLSHGIASFGPDVTCKYFCVDFKNILCFSFIVKRRLLSKNFYYRGTVLVEERLLSRDAFCQETFFVEGSYCLGTVWVMFVTCLLRSLFLIV